MRKNAVLVAASLVLGLMLFVEGRLLTASADPKPDRIKAGTLAYVKGDVYTKHAEDERFDSGEKGQTMYFGDSIKTKDRSAAAILYIDGTRSDLGAGTQIEIPSPEKKVAKPSFVSSLKLIVGKLWVKVTKRKEPFSVKTPTAVSAVKGTEFLVEVNDKGETVLSVIQGLVSFGNVMGGVLVGVSQQSHTLLGQGPIPALLINLKSLNLPDTPAQLVLDMLKKGGPGVGFKLPGGGGSGFPF